MSRFLFALVCLLIFNRLSAATPDPIAYVWAGHPVGFGLLVEQGHIYVAYYDADRRITLIGRKLGETTWTRMKPQGVDLPERGRNSRFTGWDSHNFLRLGLDETGRVHLAGNMHGDPLIYFRMERPHDVKSLVRVDRMTGERETRCTYPLFFKGPEGALFFRYRDGGSGNGSDLYNRYDAATGVWTRVWPSALLDGEGRRNAYALDPVLGPDGRFHLVWMWRDTPDCATNHTLSYARSRDFVQWETSRGEPLRLPITLAQGEVIDPAKPGDGLINMTLALGFDAEQRPLVAYHRYDRDGRSQVFVAKPADMRWETRPVSAWDFRWSFSGMGSIVGEVMVGAPRVDAGGRGWVDFATTTAGAGVLRFDPRSLAGGPAGPAVAVLPPEVLTVMGTYPGLEVQTQEVRAAGKRWVLRWETLPRNRDLPREAYPEAQPLRLYEWPDDGGATATRVGS